MNQPESNGTEKLFLYSLHQAIGSILPEENRLWSDEDGLDEKLKEDILEIRNKDNIYVRPLIADVGDKRVALYKCEHIYTRPNIFCTVIDKKSDYKIEFPVDVFLNKERIDPLGDFSYTIADDNKSIHHLISFKNGSVKTQGGGISSSLFHDVIKRCKKNCIISGELKHTKDNKALYSLVIDPLEINVFIERETWFSDKYFSIYTHESINTDKIQISYQLGLWKPFVHFKLTEYFSTDLVKNL